VKSAEIRTVAADELWLSPAYQLGVFGVHFTWQPDAAAVSALVELIEPALQPYQPRPHWGKVFGEAHQWSELYPRLTDSAVSSRSTTRVESSATPTSRAPSLGLYALNLPGPAAPNHPASRSRIHRCPVPTALCG
jgi:hypothetical protein